MGVLRTKKLEEKYKRHLKNIKEVVGCPLCKSEPLQVFKYWKIIINDFPYNKVAKEHHMIIPLRHITEDSLNQKESAELLEIKSGYIKDYNYNHIVESTVLEKTLPKHFHLHLIKLKS